MDGEKLHDLFRGALRAQGREPTLTWDILSEREKVAWHKLAAGLEEKPTTLAEREGPLTGRELYEEYRIRRMRQWTRERPDVWTVLNEGSKAIWNGIADSVRQFVDGQVADAAAATEAAPKAPRRRWVLRDKAERGWRRYVRRIAGGKAEEYTSALDEACHFNSFEAADKWAKSLRVQAVAVVPRTDAERVRRLEDLLRSVLYKNEFPLLAKINKELTK